MIDSRRGPETRSPHNARWAVLASQIAMRLTIALGQTIVIVGVGVAFFQVPMESSWAALFGMVMLGALAFIALGYVVAAFSKNQETASGISSLLNFPMMFLSGTFWPREFIPDALQPVIDLLPLTPLVEALRGVATHGHGLEMHWPGMLYLAGWGAVAMVLAVRRFRWE